MSEKQALAIYVAILLKLIFEKWDKIIKFLKRWCLSRWYLGWSNRWYLALFMLPCRFIHISDERVREEYVSVKSLVDICERPRGNLCGFFIALVVTVARAQGFDASYFRARYGECCKNVPRAKLPGRYIMCRVLGAGRFREMEKELKRIIKRRLKEDMDYYVKLVKLALGVKDIYDVKAAYCVPFVYVSDHNSGSGETDEESEEPIAQVVEACRRLKAAVERAVS